jgi:hypothetical protein
VLVGATPEVRMRTWSQVADSAEFAATIQTLLDAQRQLLGTLRKGASSRSRHRGLVLQRLIMLPKRRGANVPRDAIF